MKYGRSLEDLAREITRQAESKRDYVASTANMEMTVTERESGSTDLVTKLRLGDDLDMGIRPIAHAQIAEHTKVPKNYYDRMLAEEPALLADNINTWLHKNPSKRMVRTLDGHARAYLSDSFRPLDNFDMLEACLPKLLDRGVEVMSCQVTDTKLYLKVVDKRIQRDIPTGRRLGDGSHVFFDTASPALVLSNSEVGWGAMTVQTSVYTHMCTNLCVVKERSKRTMHLGAKADIGEDIYKLLSDDTRQKTDEALWGQIRDVVGSAFDLALFDATVAKIGEAAQDVIEADPVKVVEVTAKKFGLSDGERGGILANLIKGGDLTRYGLHAAITRTAEDLPDYDRASHFEQLGGKVIELDRSEWKQMTQEWKQAA